MWADGCSAVPRPRQRGHVRIFMEIWSPGGRYTIHYTLTLAMTLHRWYHGNISRLEAEAALRLHPSGSYLVRNCESARKDYSLSLK